MSEPRTPQAERDALEALLLSDGWAIVKEMIATAYGPEAFEREFDGVMAQLRPGDDERAVTTQIRAAFKAVRGIVSMVESRAAALKDVDKKPNAAGRFPQFRRGPRA